MKTSFEKKTNGLVALSVKIEKEELEKYIEEVFIKEKEKLQIKGFRIGQAPEEIAKDFISQEKIFNEAAEKAVKDSLKKVGEENGWILIDSPKVKFEEDKEGLSFKAELTLFPEVELPDYKIIAKRANEEVKEKIKKITVEEEEIKKAIEWLIEARGLEKEKELTDEIVKSMGDFKTVGDLKKSIKEGLRAEKIVREGDKNRAKIIDEICEVGTMYGNISFFEGKPYIHCHISIGKDDFTGMAGHLKGAEVAATAEITLISLGGSVGRKYSDEIGLNLYEF